MAIKKKIEDLSVDRIWADNDRNFRHGWKYKVEPLPNYDPTKSAPGFYEDIVQNGVQTNIEVSRLTDDQKDRIEKKHGIRPDFRVIRGHRRFAAVTLARQREGEHLFKKLTCVVYEGLSEQEEIALMYDHKGVESLDEYETYKAIIKLFGAGHSQEKIANIIGQSRQYVQDRIHIYDLPDPVKVEWEKRFTPVKVETTVNGVTKVESRPPKKGEDYVHFVFKDVEKMHKAWNADQAAGIPHDSPNSQWKEIWDGIVNKMVAGPAKPPKALSFEEAEKRSGYVKGCEALEEAHKFYTNQGGNIQEAAEMYRHLESQAKRVPALESEVASLKRQVADLTALLAEKDAEIASLKVGVNGVEQHA